MALNRIAVVLLAIGCVDCYKAHRINTNNRDWTSLRYIIAQPGQNESQLDAGTGMRSQSFRWPRVGNRIIVPFTLDPRAGYTRLQLSKIYAAMRHIGERTCISFKLRANERDYVLIYSGKWCSSYVGRVGGGQRLSLERTATCTNHIGTVIHELVHALGFVHMQSHANRDQYISVRNENVQSGELQQFQKISAVEASNFGTPYDYYSIMHYGTHAFSKNGKPTILTRGGEFNKIIGQSVKLSEGDVTRIRNMYRCSCVEKGWRVC